MNNVVFNEFLLKPINLYFCGIKVHCSSFFVNSRIFSNFYIILIIKDIKFLILDIFLSVHCRYSYINVYIFEKIFISFTKVEE